jgi:hypothetical protein
MKLNFFELEVNPRTLPFVSWDSTLGKKMFFFGLTLLANHQSTSYELFNFQINEFFLTMNVQSKV